VTAAGLLTGALWQGKPWLAASAAAAGLAAWILRPDPDPERWRRGAAGEVATAVLLTRLPRRFVVLHDLRIPGSRANVDHLVIGPTGVWVVDSKSYRARIRVRRGAAWAGEHQVPTAAAGWEAGQVARLVGLPVGAMVAVHGEGLRRRGIVVNGVPVIPARRVCRQIRRGRGRRVLSRAAVSALATAASTSLRGENHRPRWLSLPGMTSGQTNAERRRERR
jgi:hypothetical protein